MRDLETKLFDNIHGYFYYVRGVTKNKNDKNNSLVDYETCEWVSNGGARYKHPRHIASNNIQRFFKGDYI